MKLPAYPNLKKTDIVWLDSLPDHWQIRKFRFLFTFGRGLGITKKDLKDTGIPCVNYGEIHSKFGFEVSPEKHELKCVDESYLDDGMSSMLKRGDFVYADTSEDLEGSGNFTHLDSDTPTFAGYHTVIARPQSDNSARFLAYLFDSKIYRYQIRKNVSGVKVYSITQDILKDCYAWLPPVEEQTQIARFLDYKTAQIDQLIAKKKQLIEKLNEQRIAIITNAVTKGLDPTVNMKDSKVDWLGMIPSHWEVWKVTHGFGYIGSGTTPKSDNPDYYEGEIPWITTSELRENLILDAKQKVTQKALQECSSLRFYEKGSIVIAMYGATIGRLGILGIDATVNQACCVFSKPERFYPKFFYFWLWMRRPILISLSVGGGQPNLSQDDLKKLKVPVPPTIEEQIEIVEHIEQEISYIDSVIEKNELLIKKLQEYRTSLITSAVTGKIDVRSIEVPEVAV